MQNGIQFRLVIAKVILFLQCFVLKPFVSAVSYGYSWYCERDFFTKLSVWGSLASIFGLLITLLFSFSDVEIPLETGNPSTLNNESQEIIAPSPKIQQLYPNEITILLFDAGYVTFYWSVLHQDFINTYFAKNFYSSPFGTFFGQSRYFINRNTAERVTEISIKLNMNINSKLRDNINYVGIVLFEMNRVYGGEYYIILGHLVAGLGHMYYDMYNYPSWDEEKWQWFQTQYRIVYTKLLENNLETAMDFAPRVVRDGGNFSIQGSYEIFIAKIKSMIRSQ